MLLQKNHKIYSDLNKITNSSSEIFVKNSPIFSVEKESLIRARVHYKGIMGQKFCSCIVLIWTFNGYKVERIPYWIKFKNKKDTAKFTTKVPKNVDGCIIGIRINTETPSKGDADLLIEDVTNIQIKKDVKIWNLPGYFFSKLKQNLFPDDLVREKIKSPKKFWNHIFIKFQSLHLKNSLVVGYPFMAFVDPSNKCNYKCPLCPTGRSDQFRNRGIMNYENFCSIMDQIGPYLYKLHLYNWGEPFLNKYLIKMIHYAKKFNMIVESSTNLSILTPSLAQKIVHSGLDYLIVGIDGITNESYSKYRVGGNLSKVLKNLDLILNKKKQANSSLPHVIVSSLPNHYNEKEIPEARDYFSKKDISFVVGKLRLDMGDEVTQDKKDIYPFKDWLPSDLNLSVYDEELNKNLSERCLWPWELICIHPE